MKSVNKGKLFIHMMAFVLARAVFFEARPLIPGMFESGCPAWRPRCCLVWRELRMWTRW